MPVYAFRKVGTNQVKIGVSINVSRRLSTLQHAAGAELSIIHQVESDSPYVVERQLHQRYMGQRSPYGEWFVMPHFQEPELIIQMNDEAAKSSKALLSGRPDVPDAFLWLREPIADAFTASRLTSAQVAKEAAVPQPYVKKLLSGEVNLTSPRVLRVAKVLKLELLAVTNTSQELAIFRPDDSLWSDLSTLLTQGNRPDWSEGD